LTVRSTGPATAASAELVLLLALTSPALVTVAVALTMGGAEADTATTKVMAGRLPPDCADAEVVHDDAPQVQPLPEAVLAVCPVAGESCTVVVPELATEPALSTVTE
jgi:hypothetical protein